MAAVIRASLPLRPAPSCPEILLHLATPTSGVGRLVARGGSPYWAYPWGGGLALARYLLDHPEVVARRRVLDLGTGSGLVAIAAAKAGAEAVTGADVDPFAMAALGLNAEANGVAISPLLADLLDGPPPAFELILVGDLFYSRPLARRSLRFLQRCRAAGLEVLVGDPYRASLPRDALQRLATYDVPDVGGGSTPAAVFALSPAEPRSPGRRGSRRSP